MPAQIGQQRFKPYRAFVCRISQFGLNNPDLTILENDFGGTWYAERINIGYYKIIMPDDYNNSPEKTAYFFGNTYYGYASGGVLASIVTDYSQGNSNAIQFYVMYYDTYIDGNGDIGLSDTYFEFRLYD